VLPKAAALLHSLASNHARVDSNKRLAWLRTYAFIAKNRIVLDADDDAAYEFVIAVVDGSMGDVGEIVRSSPRLPRAHPTDPF
jgi:death on curing protein